MSVSGILFPHQLFAKNMLIARCDTIYLVEEELFFRQYSFHKQKIAFHRASMKFYENYLRSKKIEVVYIDAFSLMADIRILIPHLKTTGVDFFEYIDTTDCWLEQRIATQCKICQIRKVQHPSPLFINSVEEITGYFSGNKRMFQADFYKYQRQYRNVLLEGHQEPIGGKWSFDEENRKKYPKRKTVPQVDFLPANEFYKEAMVYTRKYFPGNYGQLNGDFIFPSTYTESENWLLKFLQTRFSEFGAYEDAILEHEHILHHSVLTPMLNVGLLTPQFVVDEILKYAAFNEIPLNSLEGFIRQIIGWREFIRAVYIIKGTEERTRNFWGFTRKIPASFWTGTTGIGPVDMTIKKVLKTGYCHHIERLMVLGNFMLLCEFDPDEVYRWFMELFVDAYDWVMVPNVYGMSQFSDGGLMATKPYLSGSHYLMKMGDYKKGDWQEIWDGLFWRFMHVHRNFFLSNPRLSMLVNSFDKMTKMKQDTHMTNAEKYLESISAGLS